MTLDFLSSDIIFPSDSNEPKLAAGVVTKLPEPVDWAFHDYYSTASEKASMPLHSLTDYCRLEPVENNNSSSINAKSAASEALVADHLVSPTSPPLPPLPAQDQHQQYLRAILCGALETVNNSMQDNHLTRLDKMLSNTISTKNEDWRWEDDIMSNSSVFSFPQQQQQRGLGYPTLSSTASSLAPGDEDDNAGYPSPIYVEDEEDDLMSSGLTSLILSALPPPPLPSPPSPALQEQQQQQKEEAEIMLSSSSRNDRIPYFYSAPLPSLAASTTARANSQEGRGKPAIAKSTVWQNLVGRLKKNLTSPQVHNKKEMAVRSSQPSQPPQLSSNPLKRLFKSRLH